MILLQAVPPTPPTPPFDPNLIFTSQGGPPIALLIVIAALAAAVIILCGRLDAGWKGRAALTRLSGPRWISFTLEWVTSMLSRLAWPSWRSEWISPNACWLRTVSPTGCNAEEGRA